MKPQINFSDFSKLELRVGKVTRASPVENSTKLVELKVSFGKEIGTKTIYAGVRNWYKPGKLTGRKLGFVVNLAPKVFKIGSKEYTSEGMLLAADPGDKAVLYQFDEDLPAGSRLR